MDVEARLRRLEASYSLLVFATRDAKAQYLARAAGSCMPVHAVEEARSKWHKLRERKREIAARMGEVEPLDP
jgi:hypothetical protein